MLKVSKAVASGLRIQGLGFKPSKLPVGLGIVAHVPIDLSPSTSISGMLEV